MFTLFKGQKIFFFQKWPKYGLVLEKKIKNSSSSFFLIRGGGVKPEMTNVISFFLIKASLSKEAYLCPHCGKSFGEIQKFRDHCGRNPSREIPICSVCQRTFCSPGKLKQHQAIHENGGKLECTICLKRFKCHRNLQQHYKHHIEKIEFKCNLCFKIFSSVFNLNRHKNRKHKSA